MNEQQTLLEDSVTRLFGDQVTSEVQRAAETDGWVPELWDLVVEQGLTDLLLSEDKGGMGAGWLDAFVVARACGRHAVPLPVPETQLALWLLEHAGCVVPPGLPALLPRALSPEDFAHGRLDTTVAGVPWGRRADYYVGLLTSGARTELVWVGRDQSRCAEAANLAREPRDELHFHAAEVLGRGDIALPSDAVRWLGALLRSAQIAGAAASCVELSVRYTSEREQFGRALSQFQAIQQQLAELAGAMASVDTIAMSASAALDEHGLTHPTRDAKLEIAAAKCRASDAVERITRISHQVHGAIGFTYEYSLQYLTRRLWSWRAEFGTQAEWGEWLGRAALAQGGDGLWPYLTR